MTAQHSIKGSTGGADDVARAPDQGDRALRVEFMVDAAISSVWNAWSTASGLEAFFAPKANIEWWIGGAYELFFNPADERVNTKGCKLLTYLPREMISFQWSLPGDVFPELPKAATWVIVQLRPASADRTEVRIAHLGWGTGPVWDRAFSHMQVGWEMVATLLKQRFEHGPMDWEAQRAKWQEARREVGGGTIQEPKS